MTKCKFDYNNLELICEGHASERDEDNSICTALTTLVLTLAYDVDQLADLCEEKTVDIKPGYYHIKVTPTAEGKEQLEFLFTAFVNGIYMLSEDEKISQHIKLEVNA